MSDQPKEWKAASASLAQDENTDGAMIEHDDDSDRAQRGCSVLERRNTGGASMVQMDENEN